jgi:hypothetical protein
MKSGAWRGSSWLLAAPAAVVAVFSPSAAAAAAFQDPAVISPAAGSRPALGFPHGSTLGGSFTG